MFLGVCLGGMAAIGDTPVNQASKGVYWSTVIFCCQRMGMLGEWCERFRKLIPRETTKYESP